MALTPLVSSTAALTMSLQAKLMALSCSAVPSRTVSTTSGASHSGFRESRITSPGVNQAT
jgi:hypothetical protein